MSEQNTGAFSAPQEIGGTQLERANHYATGAIRHLRAAETYLSPLADAVLQGNEPSYDSADGTISDDDYVLLCTIIRTLEECRNGLNEYHAAGGRLGFPLKVQQQQEQEQQEGEEPMDLRGQCNYYRARFLELEENMRKLRDQGNPNPEVGRNLSLAITHTEDARMRIGKVLQYGTAEGKNIYDMVEELRQPSTKTRKIHITEVSGDAPDTLKPGQVIPIMPGETPEAAIERVTGGKLNITSVKVNTDPPSVPYAPEVTQARYACPNCGGTMMGDGFSTPWHCENVDAYGIEPDSAPLYCPPAAQPELSV